MVRNVYFAAAILMAIFALVMGVAQGLLWGLAIGGAAVALAFIGLSKTDGDSEGNGNARR